MVEEEAPASLSTQAAVVEVANEADKDLQNRIIKLLAGFLLATFLVVGIGVGILVYNSVNNEPKINCIYSFSKTGVDDIHHLLHNDKNPADYPEAKCG